VVVVLVGTLGVSLRALDAACRDDDSCWSEDLCELLEARLVDPKSCPAEGLSRMLRSLARSSDDVASRDLSA